MSEEKKDSKVTIADIHFQGQMLDGEVGIEIEVEGRRLPAQAGKFWTVTRDGSLRGEEAFEYVLTTPVTRKEVSPALTELYNRFDKSKSVLDDTGRAGVHIHINIRDLSIKELYTFLFLYLILERPLVNFCGENRVGNLFCLRAVDAEFLLVTIRTLVANHDLRSLRNDQLRYAAMNLTAIPKYGSLEFRAMASPVKQEKIEAWTNMLLAIKDAVKQFESPLAVVEGVSFFGGEDFARSILRDNLALLGEWDWNKEVVFGMRLIQPLVNNLNQEALNEIEVYWKEQKERQEAMFQPIPEAVEGRGRVYDGEVERELVRSLRAYFGDIGNGSLETGA